MNWKEFNDNVKEFATKYSLEFSESDLSFVNGKQSIYRMIENRKAFYEFKHSKVVSIQRAGSKFRLYSKCDQSVIIKVKQSLFGKPNIKSNIEIPDELRVSLISLSKIIDPFSWCTQKMHKGWPNELHHNNVLIFQCSNLFEASSNLEIIRSVNMVLLTDLKSATENKIDKFSE